MEDLNLHRRIGRFEIGTELVRHQTGDVIEFMKGMLVIRAETLLHKNVVEYYAINPAFEIVPVEANPPTYNAEYDDNGNVVWEKVT